MAYYGNTHHEQQNNSASSSGNNNIDAAKIFVGGLSWQTTEEPLRYHFEQYGEVSSVEVMRDRNTGDPRGFAFVVFKSDETVDLILKAKPHEINHKVVDVKRAQARGIAPPSIHPRDAEEPGPQQSMKTEDTSIKNEGTTPEHLGNKVFVGGLPLHVDKDALQDFFSCFGPVTDVIVMMDMIQQRSRGFGFVTFENGSGGAQKAIEAQPINMFGKNVEVKLATPKGDRDVIPGGLSMGPMGGGAGLQSNNFFRKPITTTSTGEFAGLASSYGRAGWRAGYGSKAFGKAGWCVVGWDDGGDAPDETGFSFSMLDKSKPSTETESGRQEDERQAKRTRSTEKQTDRQEDERSTKRKKQ